MHISSKYFLAFTMMMKNNVVFLRFMDDVSMPAENWIMSPQMEMPMPSYFSGFQTTVVDGRLFNRNIDRDEDLLYGRKKDKKWFTQLICFIHTYQCFFFNLTIRIISSSLRGYALLSTSTIGLNLSPCRWCCSCILIAIDFISPILHIFCLCTTILAFILSATISFFRIPTTRFAWNYENAP